LYYNFIKQIIIRTRMVTTGLQNNNTNTGRFNLVLCEILNKNIHGNDDNIDGHYLIINKFDASTGSAIYSDSDTEEYDSDSDSETDSDSSETSLSLFTSDYNDYYHQVQPNVKHTIIRNYRNIIARSDYIRPEIAECIVLPSQHNIAIIKTIWIKIIQRKWKKVYAERNRIINVRMLYSSLKTREITGNWPSSCNYLPTLYRMLADLN
jgi:hypothetical protein